MNSEKKYKKQRTKLKQEREDTLKLQEKYKRLINKCKANEIVRQTEYENQIKSLIETREKYELLICQIREEYKFLK